jgi:hypothetical protein
MNLVLILISFKYSLILGFLVFMGIFILSVETSPTIIHLDGQLKVKYMPFKFWKNEVNIPINQIEKLEIQFYGKNVYDSYDFIKIKIKNNCKPLKINLGLNYEFSEAQLLKTKLESILNEEILIV